ncbi:CsxC family protein [Desnuesiella massiliensis]|uniref:CsxC family protein n=1 Tax=Desnuesiella massiliensis TaxID=1650662 RepID=UPI0006E26FC7|nr:hypothetical protein [Desnuesiella massiliensis]
MFEDKSDFCEDRPRFCGEVHAETLSMCEGENVTPMGISGPVVSKIPVVLAEKEIQIDIEASIELKEKFFEIKRIKKDIFLTQCRLLPTAGRRDPVTGRLISGKLFIEGFVLKNIEFATADCSHDHVVSGDIKHTTAKIPFRCVTEVFFVTQPQVTRRINSVETNFFCEREHDCKHCKDEEIGRDLCETDREETVFFDEKPFCELVSARFIEADINREPEHKDGTRVFEKLVEKLVVFLTVKVLQKQQVRVR